MQRSLLLSLFSLLSLTARADDHRSSISWRPWSENVFQEAAASRKLVILNLEAVWCHWCHVMDAQTYSNPEVAAEIAKNYIPLRVDQDSRPDLSNRYQDYGWPATIIFNSEGLELVKRAGFVEPADMLQALRRSVADPKAAEEVRKSAISFPQSPELSSTLREALEKRHASGTDPEIGGLKLAQRFLDADTIEYAIRNRLRENDRQIALLTLQSNRKLFDPAWGGVYQYSTHFGWDRPHFEKIMSSQANNLRVYALAARAFDSPDFEFDAGRVHHFLSTFLRSPEGAFYTSQDADVVKGKHSEEYFALGDSERRKIGIPAVDRHIYSRENGWAIEALAIFAGYLKSEEALRDAERAAEWILNNRSLSEGGFRHDERDAAGPYLGDSLAMSRAFLALYTITAERKWIDHARGSADFILRTFVDVGGEPGFFTTPNVPTAALPPIRQVDENIGTVRHLNLLYHYTGNTQYREAARQGMRYLGTEQVALDRFTEPGILTAAEDLARDPLHVTVVGGRSDDMAKKLFAEAIRQPSSYRRVEWWDTAEGPLPNPDVQYPPLPRSAAFICTNKRCSLPIFEPQGISATIESFEKRAMLTMDVKQTP